MGLGHRGLNPRLQGGHHWGGEANAWQCSVWGLGLRAQGLKGLGSRCEY